MNNGEGNNSPDRFDEKSEAINGSPAPSDYSSCGESEFERYCSANSVMGTPSMCSSVGTFNDFLDLDFGSIMKSSGDKLAMNSSDRSVSDYNGDVYGFGSPKILNKRNTLGNNDSECSTARFSRVQKGSDLLSNYNPQSAGARKNEEHRNSVVASNFHYLSRSSDSPMDHTTVCDEEFPESTSKSFDPFVYEENGCSDEEVSSSRYGLSDEDGSMFNDDSGDEQRMDSYTRNLHYRQDSAHKNENSLLIGSAVAFGSEDWDDFMQQTENGLVTLSLSKPKDKQEEILETEGTHVNSALKDPLSSTSDDKEQAEIMRSVPVTTCLDNVKKDPESLPTRDSMGQVKDFLAERALLNAGLNVKDSATEGEPPRTNNKEIFRFDEGDTSENEILGKSKSSDSLLYTTGVQLSSAAIAEGCSKEALHSEYHKVHGEHQAIVNDSNACVKAKTKSPPTSVNLTKEHLAPIKVGNSEAKESYEEVVLEMEEILLDSMETPGARFPHSKRSPQPFRDGSSTASTSGTDDAYPLLSQPLKIDGIEVVGAKQRKGDVSLGERLVGVKEYTVYSLRVKSGNDQWDVERRYRDFFMLYRQLKTLYASHGWSLPTPWSLVEQDSRKFFGNASPKIVGERSTLIQECLRSILHSSTPNSVPSTLNWFLSPQKAISSPSMLNTFVPHSISSFTGGSFTEEVSTFGKTISLMVEIQPRKSVKQLLEAQHYICAGCHKRLDAEKSLMREFVQTLGWGKPRLCEYTGQLFCASCHTNETAVLPARVLHFWDFTGYPVSQMAKSYLDSIYDQPMLCVSAVNPFLFSKVPALFHVMSIRKKIGAMMPYVRCSFRRTIQRGVGSRRYLLENNEFFALRDLVDLSKGAFSALPVMVETVSRKILDHIKQQCLVCYDVGVPCGARQACEDPSSLIFPFQEDDEVKRCKSCDLVFHKPCFKKLANCPCSVGSDVGQSAGQSANLHDKSVSEALDTLGRKSDSGSPVKFLSYMFSKKKQGVLSPKNSNPVILMGSLPSTFSDPL